MELWSLEPYGVLSLESGLSSQSIENQTLRIKHVNIHNMKRGLRTQLEFIYWECNEEPVSSRIKLCPYARFAKIKLCPYAAQAAHERHPGTLCQFPRGMVAHPWPGLGFSKKCRNVTIVPLRYLLTSQTYHYCS